MGKDSNPTVRFVVQHSRTQCWGRVIQGPARTWTGPYGYFEELQVPVKKEGAHWVGTVVIVPCSSLSYLTVCMLHAVNNPFFGVRVLNVLIPLDHPGSRALLSAQGRQLADQLHRQAWEDIASASASDPYAKYGLYASRSLAVAHPEVYLQGDALFVQHVTQNPGFAAAYAVTDPDSESLYPQTFFSGPPFSFRQVSLATYTAIRTEDRYPKQAPVLGWLDWRMLSLPAVLKARDKQITELERATIAYFSWHEQGREQVFIMVCVDESAYLVRSSDGALFVADGTPTGARPNAATFLIFNEDHVWYPLMGRDDTSHNAELAAIVGQYASAPMEPEMSDFERAILAKLRETTRLGTAKEKELARLASVKGNPSLHPFRQIYARHLLGYPSQVWQFAIVQQWVLRANRISPWTAWLAALAMDRPQLIQGLETATGVWAQGLGIVHGHDWQCSLNEYTIDETVSVSAVHCVTHANCFASVLDLAGVENILIKGSPAPPGSPGITHTYVVVPEAGVVISNGAIAERGSLVNVTKYVWSALWYISKGDLWAFPYLALYVGTWAPRDVAEQFALFRNRFGDQFCGFRSWGYDETFFRRETVSPGAFLNALPDEQRRWSPFRHP